MKYLSKIFMITGLILSSLILPLFLFGCGLSEKAKEEQIKAVFRRVLDETWNKGNFETFDELYDPNFIRHRPPFPDIVGLDAHKKRFAVVFSAFPDHKGTFHDILVDGDKVAVWYTWHGTHSGSGLPIVPTDKKVNVTGCDVYRLVDGKVVEEWDHEGFLSLFQQLGYTITPPGLTEEPEEKMGEEEESDQ
ncbi:MAG: ester cyclase [Candidatus Latescibacteria bacterium]|nr:ester cyclase [Candidatus Latescibacterota bacterium]